MLDQIFGRFFSSQWIVFAVLVILLVGLSELAWRMGLAGSRKKSEADRGSGTVRSAVLALLGLLLGFSFAIAGARHEARRELLVEEANSIGTTARRAQLLPEPHAHRRQTQPRARRCLAATAMRNRLRLVARQLSGGNFRASFDS